MNNNTIALIAKSGRRCSYMVLCYARMRIRMPEGAWFTRNDYHDFQDGRISRGKIKHYTNNLTESGLLERHPNGIMWRITQSGLEAIPEVDKRFALMNPHGKSHSASAIHSRQKQLRKEEERLLNRLASKAPVVTK